MNLEEIKALIELANENEIAELEVESEGTRVRIRREAPGGTAPGQPPYFVVHSTPEQIAGGAAPPSISAPQGSGTSPPEAGGSESDDEESKHEIVSAPIVGTFYEAPSPDAPAFAQVGDRVTAGQVLCIIEAMKLMNEIEAETAGVIVKRFVSNAQPVEYGAALFAIDTTQ